MSQKILVVDDDTSLLSLTNMVLERADFQTRTAQSGEAALEVIKTWQPDLFLIDVMMPNMSGLELITKLRAMAAYAKTPIIILTSLDQIETKSAGFEAGADDYITKPYQKAELLLRVNANLRRFRMSTPDDELEPNRVITVFSLRGGSGCTTIAVNLAVALSQMWQDQVGLADLVRPVGACDVAMNLKARYNVADIMTNELEDIDENLIELMMEPHESGVNLLGGISQPEMADFVSEAHTRHVIGLLRKMYRYTVIDTTHSFGPEAMAALDLSDSIVLVVPPEIISVRLVRSVLHVFERLEYDPDKIIVVVNWTFSSQGLTSKKISSVLKQPVSSVIHYLGESATRAINVGVPILLGEDRNSLLPLMADLGWMVSRTIDQERVPEVPPPLLAAAIKRNAS